MLLGVVLCIPLTCSNGLNISFYLCVQFLGVIMADFTSAGCQEPNMLSVSKVQEVIYYDY